MLLPAWVSIATVSEESRPELWPRVRVVLIPWWQTLTFLYHLTQREINIKKETSASLSVFSIASFISMCSLLLQLHLTRENDPVVPFFVMARTVWEYLLNLAM